MAISADSPAQVRRLAKKLKIPFPLLSDPKLLTIRAYGVREKGRRIAVPSVFVIRKDGTIYWRHVGSRIWDRPSIDTILKQVRRVSGS